MRLVPNEAAFSQILSVFRREERQGIHVSDLVSPCLRKVYYSRVGLLTPKDKDIIMWIIGKGYHSLLENKIREIYLEKDNIIGHPDCLVRDSNGEMIPMEWKSTRISSGKPIPRHWVEQMNAYAYMYGNTKIRLGILYLMGDWREERAEMAIYDVSFDKEELTNNWNGMLCRRDKLLSALEDKIPPPGPDANWACQYCNADCELRR